MGRTGRIEPVEDHAMEGCSSAAEGSRRAPFTSSASANLATPELGDSGSIRAEPIPSSRLLKPAPTHVETTAENPLSPPKVETERRLNLARGSPAHASHPTSSPREPRPELKAAATVAAAGGTHGKDEVTAALRRLAEGGGGVTSAKVVSFIYIHR